MRKNGPAKLEIASALRCPPVIWLLFVIQMTNAGHEWGVTLFFCPIDGVPLGLECAEHMVSMVFDDVVFDLGTLRTSLRARFDIYVRHALSPWHSFAFLAVKIPAKRGVRLYGHKRARLDSFQSRSGWKWSQCAMRDGLDQYLGTSET